MIQMSELVKRTRKYVEELFKQQLSAKYTYHNIEHTKRVVKKVKQLAELENCSEKEKEILELSAWLHDIGFVQQNLNNEPIGAKMAEEFLRTENYPSECIEFVKQNILATAKNTSPITLLQKILKDADCAHVASKNYFELSDQLHKEFVLTQGEISELDWLKGNQEFFEQHQFYTPSAQAKWQQGKEVNLYELDKKIIKKLKRQKADIEKENAPRKRGRGVETMFRVTLKNHLELSAIADTKANILLSVNAIIISVALSSLMPRLDNISNAHLIVPTMILLVCCVTCVVLSVLSTRPNISKTDVSREMIQNNQTNILFFGNFYKMSLKDFDWGINYLIDNEEALYSSMTKDLYYLGLVLERKYRLLRITYNVFMAGIIISAIAFIVGFMLRGEAPVAL